MQSYQSLSYFLLTLLIIMSPLRVSPEENTSKENDPFAIPATTQARIYASLDSQTSQDDPQPTQSSEKISSQSTTALFGDRLSKKLSEWWPNGLFWTPDDDDDDNSNAEEGDQPKNNDVTEIHSDDDELLLNRSFVVEVESSSTSIRSTSNRASFHDILQSFQEGDRILEQEFDEVSSSDEFDASGATLDNRFGLGDGIELIHHQSRRRRRRDTDSDATSTDSSSSSSFSSSSASPGPLNDTMCLGIPPGKPHRPGEALSCYTCRSSTSDQDPKCDYRLWKYLRHSEKFNLRGRCGRGSHACMRRVSRRHGLRLTERGCVPLPLLIHADEGLTHATFSAEALPQDEDSEKMKELKPEGCYTHSQKDGFLTTACFCKSNLCNGASSSLGGGGYPQLFPKNGRRTESSSMFSMIGICAALFLYGLAFALFKD